MTLYRRIVATAALATALLATGLAPAVADDEPVTEPAVIAVSGVLVPTDEFAPYDVGLCSTECFNGLSINPSRYAEVDSEGAFTFDDVEQGSTYKMGVLYFTYKYLADGTEKQIRAKGYLRAEGDRLVLTSDFDAADSWTMDDDLGSLSVFVPADTRPKPQVSVRFKPIAASALGDFFIGMLIEASRVEKGTRIIAKVFGCGGKLVAKEIVKGKTGRFEFRLDTTADKVGRKIPVSLKAVKKGHRPSSLKYIQPYPDNPNTC